MAFDPIAFDVAGFPVVILPVLTVKLTTSGTASPAGSITTAAARSRS